MPPWTSHPNNLGWKPWTSHPKCVLFGQDTHLLSELFGPNAQEQSSKRFRKLASGTSCRLWMSRCYALFHSSSSFLILSVSFQSLILSSQTIFHFVPFIPFHLLPRNLYIPPPHSIFYPSLSFFSLTRFHFLPSTLYGLWALPAVTDRVYRLYP